MKADWSQLQAKIAPPQAPVSQPLSKPFWGAGKMLALVSGAAVLTTAGVLLYNTYIYDGEKMPSLNNPAATIENNSPAANQTQETQTNNSVTLNNQPVENISAQEQDKAFSDKPIYGKSKNGKTGNNPAANNPTTGKKDIYVFSHPDNNGNNPTADNNNLYRLPAPASSKENNAQQPVDKNGNSLSKKNLIFSDTVFCLGNGLSVSYSGAQMPEAAVIEWGDGNMQTFARTNRYFYNKTGRYRVRIADGNKVFEKIITVSELPKAYFANYECDRLQCKFRNNSKQAYSYVWNFGDGTPEVRENHPEHLFTDTGRYNVTLKAYNPSGCIDSFVQQIRVTANNKPNVPNYLTPNGDGMNDKFTVNISDAVFYQIKIFNSSNKVVFESKNADDSWDGTLYNQGNACPEGTYFYIITYKYSLLDPVREEKGALMLRR
jgi:gliding motility-associated-like protein